ncbi:MFS transporter, partial [Caballeronia sp. M23-90]
MSQPNAVHPPLQGAKLVIGTIAVSLAVFMNVLDTSIANVSIPSISGDLGVSSDQGTWVITSFAVANAISVPLTGWLTQRFGQVRLFMTSIVLFMNVLDTSIANVSIPSISGDLGVSSDQGTWVITSFAVANAIS